MMLFFCVKKQEAQHICVDVELFYSNDYDLHAFFIHDAKRSFK